MTLHEVYRLCSTTGEQFAYLNDQWRQLADAIVEKAVNDYIRSLVGRGVGDKSAASVKAECERFFRSNWFTTLSPLDGEMVIQKLSTGCVQRQEVFYDDEC